MARLWCLVICMLLISGVAVGETYQNPIEIEGQHTGGSAGYGIGDPFVMRYNGMYYLYPSSNEDKVRVYTSRDLVNWTYEGFCTEGRDVYFAYAPEVVYWRGKFYMCTSPSGGGHYILVSDSPLGPFRKVTENFGHVIDGSFWVDDAGQLIFVYPEDWVIRAKYVDEVTMRPEGVRFSLNATLKHWTEGPGILRRGDWYYLTLTGNHVCSTGYRVAYASQKTENPIAAYFQREDDTLLINSVFGESPQGLGHNSMCVGPDLDSIYAAYHNMLTVEGPARRYNLDRLLTNGGLMYTTGPTSTAVAVPAMPDVWGDLDGDVGGFVKTDAGWFAQVPATQVFTQECNFTGAAVWKMGETDAGQEALVYVDDASVRVEIAGQTVVSAELPPMGEAGRLHTLRVEHAPGKTCIYVDGMRVIQTDSLEMVARVVGAYAAEGSAYHFAAHTAQAFGTSDNAAEKTMPGTFQAVHCVNWADFAEQTVGTREEQALLLDGTAKYALRVAQAGEYCFDITVRPEDAGKTITLSLDGQTLAQAVVPAYTGKASEMVTFTTAPFMVAEGLHTLEISGEDVLMSKVASFAFEAVTARAYDFSTKEQRQDFTVLGAFRHTPTEGTLAISANKAGFALLGAEGYTDYEVYLRFQIPMKGTGTSGLMMRATDVSLYEHQVKESFFGWQIGLSSLGISVGRAKYGVGGTTEFCAVPDWKGAQEGELIATVSGNTLTLRLPGQEKPLLTITDAHGFTHGLAGLFSTGKELTVLEMRISPIVSD